MHINDSGELVLGPAPDSGVVLASSSYGTHLIHFLLTIFVISPSALSVAFVAKRQTVHWPVCDIPLEPTCPNGMSR